MLRRARGEDLKRIQMVMGDARVVLPTEAGLTEAVVRATWLVSAITWRMVGPGLVRARLHLKWWAWLFPFISHARALRVARETITTFKAAGLTVAVVVW